MDSITIIQHNVLHWESRKTNLINTYLTINPQIILINGHGLRNYEQIKLPGYITYQLNTSNELHDGLALLIKSYIKQTR